MYFNVPCQYSIGILSTPVTIIIVPGRNLLHIALGSTQYEKEAPPEDKVCRQIQALKNRKKEENTQAYVPPFAELGHKAFRLTMI